MEVFVLLLQLLENFCFYLRSFHHTFVCNISYDPDTKFQALSFYNGNLMDKF